ncbi:MAG: glycosyltransferase [Candidatus Sericytochromatia bacterium]|nr:glycosyltransferase [Candidatus Sericytochromatia bacterium]
MNILLTNHHLRDFGGSEAVTRELAIELQAQGHRVRVATLDAGPPFSIEIARVGIPVLDLWTMLDAPSDIDLAWVHHAPVFHRWLQLGGRARRVIFSSLSPFEPLEAPPPWAREAALCLANSTETRERLIQLGLPAGQIRVVPNPVGRDWLAQARKPSEGPLRRLLLVSNHPPAELLEASSLLGARGIEVVPWGVGGNYALLEPEDLAGADAVVTIGRTVQAALVLGVPVFCYDHFGGPGWLVPENVAEAGARNFSGRCTGERLTGEELAQAILDGYDRARATAGRLRAQAREAFVLEEYVRAVLVEVERAPDLGVEVLERWFRDNPADTRYLRQMERVRQLEAERAAGLSQTPGPAEVEEDALMEVSAVVPSEEPSPQPTRVCSSIRRMVFRY